MPRIICFSMLLLSVAAVGQEARVRPLPELDKGVRTGPPVGARIPAFEVADQFGQKRTFEALRGPKGLVLLFIRSADW